MRWCLSAGIRLLTIVPWGFQRGPVDVRHIMKDFESFCNTMLLHVQYRGQPRRTTPMPDTTPGMGPQDAAERQRFEHEVHRIVGAAAEAEVGLRLLGSPGFHLHCPEFGGLQAKMGRAYTDIDFASYGRQAKRVSELLARLGYQENREIFVVTEGSRAIFENPANRLHVDVFYEKLDFCPVIPGNGRPA